jgi:hypothetical protein
MRSRLKIGMVFQKMEIGWFSGMRIYAFYQKCRDAKKTQISLDLKKCRYVKDIGNFKDSILLQRYHNIHSLTVRAAIP